MDIFQKSKGQLLAFRQNLMKYYMQIKCATLNSMFESVNYDGLPNEGEILFHFQSVFLF